MQCLKDSLGYLGSLLSPPTGHHGRLRPVPDADDTQHSLQPKLPDAGGAETVDFPDGDDATGVLHHWALLVAGSSGWGNYRHQSDVAHAYQVPLRRADTGTRIQTLILMMARSPSIDDGSPPFPTWVPRCSSGVAIRTTTLSS